MNRFRLPKQFPNVIKILDRLAPRSEMPDRVAGTLVKGNQDAKLLITRTRIFLIQEDNAPDDISGVVAERFNIYIWDLWDCLMVAFPKLAGEGGELRRFRDWLREQEKAERTKRRIIALRKEATDLGFSLTEAGKP